ncbi:MAG: hypothetical protein RR932_06125 [Acinetobacter sp.]
MIYLTYHPNLLNLKANLNVSKTMPFIGITFRTVMDTDAWKNLIPPPVFDEKGIRLEFAQFGHFDSFEVFRSLTSMAGLEDHELPAPIATGLKTMRFIDQINLKSVLDRDLYYRVRVLRENQSLLSDELKTYISTFNAPQNLTVVFANNALEIEWDFENVTKHNYYCSETPIDSENLPVPKVILDGETRSYIDTDVEVGRTYYVRVGSVKNGVEKISEEQSVYASNIDQNYKVKLLTSNNSLIDNGYSQLGWIESGAITYSADNEISFDENGYLLSANNFEFNANWKIEFDFLIPADAVSSYFELFKNMGGWNTGGIQISVGGDGSGSLQNKFFVNMYGATPTMSTTTISRDMWYSATVERSGTTYVVKIGDVSNSSIQSQIPNNAQMFIGGSTSTASKCKLRNIKVS